MSEGRLGKVDCTAIVFPQWWEGGVHTCVGKLLIFMKLVRKPELLKKLLLFNLMKICV